MATDSIVYWQILSSSVLYAFPHKSQSETSYTYKYIYIYIFFVQLFVGKKGAAGITNVWKVIYSIKYVGVFLPLSVPVLSHLCI